MGGALGLVAILIHAFTDYNMYVPANALVAVTLLALVSGHFRYTTERYWLTLQQPLRIGVSTVLLATIACLGFETIKGSREQIWLTRAREHPYYSAEQIAALEKAFAIEPKNPETAYLIGEGYRMKSWQGGQDYKAAAETAMIWFKRAMVLNPYDPYSQLRYGMCLHWIDNHKAAGPYFSKALQLDPNGFYTRAHVGWHYFQLGEWALSKEWFERSLQMNWYDNPIARSYLDILKNKPLARPSDSGTAHGGA